MLTCTFVKVKLLEGERALKMHSKKSKKHDHFDGKMGCLVQKDGKNNNRSCNMLVMTLWSCLVMCWVKTSAKWWPQHLLMCDTGKKMEKWGSMKSNQHNANNTMAYHVGMYLRQIEALEGCTPWNAQKLTLKSPQSMEKAYDLGWKMGQNVVFWRRQYNVKQQKAWR